MNQLKVVKRKEIDEQKWNGLIDGSIASLPYAYSWYLDAVAENWDALVLNDYQAVMPLVWLRKLGFKCLYQPYYCQQLGVFSNLVLSVETIREMLAVTQKFGYVNINLNQTAELVAKEFSLLPKRNLLLDLNGQYDNLRKNFSENHRRNILKAEKKGLEFFEQVDIKFFQKFYLENVNRTKENFKPQHEKIFKALTKTLVAKGIGKTFGVKSSDGKLQAAVMLIFHKNRLINIINTSSAEGKKSGASHFLFNGLIRSFSGADRVLDFEGSSIASIARFYEGFGAREEFFYNYHTTIIKKLSQRFT